MSSIKVTCEVETRDAKEDTPKIVVHSHLLHSGQVKLAIEGKIYTVYGCELIKAVQNCMNA